MFYVPSISQEVEDSYLIERGIPLDNIYAQNLCGIYPLITEYITYDFAFEYLSGPTYEESGSYYERRNEVITYTSAQLTDVLAGKKYRPDFDAVFAKLDSRAARPLSTIVVALTGKEPAPDTDVDIVWQLEEVKNENRKILEGLQALTITDGMTLEEAQDVVRQAIAIVPWNPFDGPQSPPTVMPSVPPTEESPAAVETPIVEPYTVR